MRRFIVISASVILFTGLQLTSLSKSCDGAPVAVEKHDGDKKDSSEQKKRKKKEKKDETCNEETIKKLESQVKKQRRDYEGRLKDLRRQLDTTKRSAKGSQEDSRELSKQLSQLRNKLKAAESSEQKLSDARSDFQRSSKKTVREMHEAKGQAKKLNQQAKELQRQVKELQASAKERTNNGDRSAKEKRTMQLRIRELERQIAINGDEYRRQLVGSNRLVADSAQKNTTSQKKLTEQLTKARLIESRQQKLLAEAMKRISDLDQEQRTSEEENSKRLKDLLADQKTAKSRNQELMRKAEESYKRRLAQFEKNLAESKKEQGQSAAQAKERETLLKTLQEENAVATQKLKELRSNVKKQQTELAEATKTRGENKLNIERSVQEKKELAQRVRQLEGKLKNSGEEYLSKIAEADKLAAISLQQQTSRTDGLERQLARVLQESQQSKGQTKKKVDELLAELKSQKSKATEDLAKAEKSYTRRLVQLEKNLAETEKDKGQKAAKAKEVAVQLKKLQEENTVASQKLKELRSNVEKQQDELAEATKSHVQNKRSIEQATKEKEELAKRVRELEGQLKTSGDEYVRRLAGAEKLAATSLQQQTSKTVGLERQLARMQQETQELKSKNKNKVDELLAELRSQKAKTQEDLAKAEKSYSRRLTQLEKEQKLKDEKSKDQEKLLKTFKEESVGATQKLLEMQANAKEAEKQLQIANRSQASSKRDIEQAVKEKRDLMQRVRELERQVKVNGDEYLRQLADADKLAANSLQQQTSATEGLEKQLARSVQESLQLKGQNQKKVDGLLSDLKTLKTKTRSDLAKAEKSYQRRLGEIEKELETSQDATSDAKKQLEQQSKEAERLALTNTKSIEGFRKQVADLQTQIRSNGEEYQRQLSEIQAERTKLASNLEAAQTKHAQVASATNSFQQKLKALEQEKGSLQLANQKRVEELLQKVKADEARSKDLLGKAERVYAKQQKQLRSELKEANSDLEQTNSQLETTSALLATKAKKLELALKEKHDWAAKNEASLTSLADTQSRVKEFDATMAKAKSETEALQAKVSQAEQRAKAANAAKEDAETKLSRLTEQMSTQVKQLESKLEVRDDSLAVKAEAEKRMQDQVVKAGLALTNVRSNEKKLEEHIRRLEEDQENNADEAEAAAAEMAKLKQTWTKRGNEQDVKIASLSKQLEKQAQQRDKSAADLRELEQDRRGLLDRVNLLTKDVTSRDAKIEKLDNQLDSASKEAKLLTGIQAQLQTALQELNKTKERSKNEITALSAQVQQAGNEAEKENGHLQQQLKRLQKELADREESLVDLEKDLSGDVAKEADKRKELEAQVAAYERELASANKLADRLREQPKTEIAKLTQQLERQEAQLDKLSQLEQQREQTRKQLTLMQGNLNDQTKELARLNRELERRSKELKDLKAKSIPKPPKRAAPVAKQKARLGVYMQSTPGDTVIRMVDANSAGQVAGLRVGDSIRQFGGKRINSFAELATEVSTYSAGDKVPVVYVRNGRELRTEVRLKAASRQ